HAGLLFRSWLALAYLWAYWHLVRQHYGFLVLYQRRTPDLSPRVAQAEVALLWIGSLHPYLRYSLGDAILHSGLPVLVPASLTHPLRIALDVSTALLLVAAATYITARLRGRLGPRHLLLALVILFQEAVFAVLDNLLVIAAALTIFHNLQYH